MQKKKRTLEANEIVSLSGDALASVTGGCGGSMCNIFCSLIIKETRTDVTVCPDGLHENGTDKNPIGGLGG